MAFIKLGDTVINTSHIVGVELDYVSITGRCGVIVSVVSEGGLFGRKTKKFWFDGEAAKRLRDYFSNPNHVIELVPSSSPRSQARDRISGQTWRSPPHKDFEEPAKTFEPPEGFDNRWSDDPPPPTIRRRPWGPQSPNPLSATALPDSFDPPIP